MSQDIEAEFRAGYARAGLAMPQERYDLLLQAFRDYRALAAHLQAPLTEDDEPAGLVVPQIHADGLRP